MPKILVNYIYNKKTDKYSLLDNDVVFADMPIAVMEMGVEYDEVLIVPVNNQATVVEKEEYLQKNRQFKLVVNEDGSIVENENGTPIYLPKDTDVSKLRFINGQLVLIDENKEKEGNE